MSAISYRDNLATYTAPCERYRHTVTGKQYRLILEVAGACSLEGIDRRCIEVSRRDLDNSETWERQP